LFFSALGIFVPSLSCALIIIILFFFSSASSHTCGFPLSQDFEKTTWQRRKSRFRS
jgi:hypothetical protein